MCRGWFDTHMHHSTRPLPDSHLVASPDQLSGTRFSKHRPDHNRLGSSYQIHGGGRGIGSNQRRAESNNGTQGKRPVTLRSTFPCAISLVDRCIFSHQCNCVGKTRVVWPMLRCRQSERCRIPLRANALSMGLKEPPVQVNWELP